MPNDQFPISRVHEPVLIQEIEALLQIKKGSTAVDATLGGGGHTAMLLRAVGPTGRVLGIEQDPEMIRFVAVRKKSDAVFQQLIVARGNFRTIATLAQKNHCVPAQAVLFDLGVARWHFVGSTRGFSFSDSTAPLSMDLSGKYPSAAADILNGASVSELADIFTRLGEVRGGYSIARHIVEVRRKRPFRTVGDLLAILPPRRGKIHPATQLFQALRIAVNDELQALEEGISGAWQILAPSGRCAVIAYHSLEDRIVKQFFRAKAQHGLGILITKKPIIPSRNEILQNSSARSAKLRVIEKI